MSEEPNEISGAGRSKAIRVSAIAVLAISVAAYLYLLIVPQEFHLPPFINSDQTSPHDLKILVMPLTVVALLGPALGVGILSSEADKESTASTSMRTLRVILLPLTALLVSFIAIAIGQ